MLVTVRVQNSVGRAHSHDLATARAIMTVYFHSMTSIWYVMFNSNCQHLEADFLLNAVLSEDCDPPPTFSVFES